MAHAVTIAFNTPLELTTEDEVRDWIARAFPLSSDLDADIEVKPFVGNSMFDIYTSKVRNLPYFAQAYWPYIDFDEYTVPHGKSEDEGEETYSCWRLTLTFDGDNPGCYFILDVNDPNGWTGRETIPEEHKQAVMDSLQVAFATICQVTGLELTLPAN